jgi:glutamyl/glutaminyl-tRNA synthetase
MIKLITIILKKRQTYTPFYHTHFSRNEGFNKIELNFVSSKKDNNNKTTLDNMDRKRKNKILAQKASLDLLNNSDEEEEESSEVEEKPNKTVKEIKNKEKFTFAQKRRKSKKSTLNYISNKYKELEEKKDAVDIKKN